MGLINWGSSKEKQSDKSISNITSEAAANLIRTLSGGKVKYHKKLIDNVISVTSASGGAGASTIVSNVAYIAAEKGLNVLVIDLNILYPSQQFYFDIEQDVEKNDLVGYLCGKNNIGEAIESTSIASVTFANNRGLTDYINCESKNSINAFETMIRTVRGLFDLVIIDCPNKIESYLCNYALYNSDKIYTVWDEGISSIANTERLIRNMETSGINAEEKLKVILNKRTNIHYSKSPIDQLKLDLIQILPFEPDVILSSLKSEIFCNKGASSSQNAKYFCGGIEELTNKILEDGGYTDE